MVTMAVDAQNDGGKRKSGGKSLKELVAEEKARKEAEKAAKEKENNPTPPLPSREGAKRGRKETDDTTDCIFAALVVHGSADARTGYDRTDGDV